MIMMRVLMGTVLMTSALLSLRGGEVSPGEVRGYGDLMPRRSIEHSVISVNYMMTAKLKV